MDHFIKEVAVTKKYPKKVPLFLHISWHFPKKLKQKIPYLPKQEGGNIFAETDYFLEENCEKMFGEDFHRKESRNLIKTNTHFFVQKRWTHSFSWFHDSSRNQMIIRIWISYLTRTIRAGIQTSLESRIEVILRHLISTILESPKSPTIPVTPCILSNVGQNRTNNPKCRHRYRPASSMSYSGVVITRSKISSGG